MTKSPLPSEILTAYRAIEECIPSAGDGSEFLVSSTSNRTRVLLQLARSHGVPIRRLGRNELLQLAGNRARECALILRGAQSPASVTLESIAESADPSALVLLLDHVTDPHNLGAILRSADQLAVNAVIVPDRRSASLTPAVLESSAGTAQHVNLVTVANLASAIKVLKDGGFWVYSAEAGGQALHKTNLSGRIALVLGAEGGGVSRLVSERSDARIAIPIRGHADSLNVSVACGILAYEVRRQQGWLDL